MSNASSCEDPPIVIVDDEASVLYTSSVLLKTHGFKPIATLEDSRELLPFLEREGAVVVILDLMMPHLSGVQLLPEMGRYFPEIPVIVMTASQELDTAIQCMRDGALDYMVKPVEEQRFVANVKRALDMNSMQRHLRHLKSSLLAGEPRRKDAFVQI